MIPPPLPDSRRGRRVRLQHPTPDPSTVEGDPDHRPHAHTVPEGSGDRVVVRAVDGRDVRQHADDPLLTVASRRSVRSGRREQRGVVRTAG